MKKNIVLVLVLIVITGCQNIDDVSLSEKREHNENVVFANHIEGNVYNNEFVGIQMELREGFKIYDYDDLNLPAEDTGVSNILLYASLSNSESIVVTESIYEGDAYKDELIESLQDFDNESDIKTSFSKEKIMINGEETLLIEVEQDFGENRIAYFNYYFIHHGDSLITIMLSYEGAGNSELPKELLSWIELY